MPESDAATTEKQEQSDSQQVEVTSTATEALAAALELSRALVAGFDSCGRTGCCQLTWIRPACVSEHFQLHTLSLTVGLAYLVAHC